MGPKSAESTVLSLCRICLVDGATCPIFDDVKTEHGVYSKLSSCFGEKIQNIDGYPQNICGACNNTLSLICDFVTKYKNTRKILESGALRTVHVVIKKEEIEFDNGYSDNEIYQDVEEEVFTKNEFDKLDFDDDEDLEKCLIEFTKPLKLKIKKIPRKVKANVKVKVKRERDQRKRKLPPNVRKNTGHVASSVLEGYFAWDGEQWCPSKNTKKPKYSEDDLEIKTVRQGRIKKAKLPKVKKPVEPKLCDLCGETYKTQERLSLHRRKVHFPQKLQCPHCPKVCPSRFYLKRHVRRKHEKTREFVCSECGKGYCFNAELNIHIRKIHQKEKFPKKVFSCSFCDKTYACQKSVTVHERSVHTGERPAVCTVCNSTFFHEEYLKEHMRLHTGETPFKCPVCSRGYAQRGNMKSHIRIHRITECDAETLSRIKPNLLKLMKP